MFRLRRARRAAPAAQETLVGRKIAAEVPLPERPSGRGSPHCRYSIDRHFKQL